MPDRRGLPLPADHGFLDGYAALSTGRCPPRPNSRPPRAVPRPARFVQASSSARSTSRSRRNHGHRGPRPRRRAPDRAPRRWDPRAEPAVTGRYSDLLGSDTRRHRRPLSRRISRTGCGAVRSFSPGRRASPRARTAARRGSTPLHPEVCRNGLTAGLAAVTGAMRRPSLRLTDSIAA